MHELKPPVPFKIVLNASVEDFKILLRIKKCLGDRFYLRQTDRSLSRFVVGLFDRDLQLLDADLRGRVVQMSDEGVVRNSVSILYRMMGESHIDDFLDDGKLRLSTFAKCSHHESEIRRDQSEGEGILYFRGARVATAQVGRNTYLLCTSLSPFASNPNSYKTCLCIQDSAGLMNAITAAIRKLGLKVSAIVHGPCVYSAHAFEVDSIPERTEENLRLMLDDLGDRLYLMKDALPNFMIEHEYRYLWLMDEMIEGEYLDIVVENPTRYATKIEIPDYDKTFKPSEVISASHPVVSRPRNTGE